MKSYGWTPKPVSSQKEVARTHTKSEDHMDIQGQDGHLLAKQRGHQEINAASTSNPVWK